MSHNTGKMTVIRIAVWIATITLLIGMQAAAYAQEMTARIPVYQEFTSTVSGADSLFTYMLKAQAADAPMPRGSKNGEYLWQMRGNTSVELMINTDVLGRYSYTLFQQIESSNKNYVYDRQLYKVTVDFSTNSENRPFVTTIIQNPSGDKVSTAIFKNRYSGSSVVDPSKPGGGGSVQTEDNNELGGYLLLLALSALGLIGLLILVRKEGKNDKGDK